jgi:phosphohistidine phosphatase SixA
VAAPAIDADGNALRILVHDFPDYAIRSRQRSPPAMATVYHRRLRRQAARAAGMRSPIAIEQKRIAMNRLHRLLTVLAMLLCQPALADDAALWAGLRSGGDIALMRHAEAPGTGDPAGFRLDDCATQRNLSEQGRRQAEDAGTMFRSKGIASATVYSSQWCRCLDTAGGLGLGPVGAQPALNSFFDDAGRNREQTEALRQLILRRPPGRPLVMVTHQVNITALTGVYPQSGEIIVVRPENGRLTVMGRIPTIK